MDGWIGPGNRKWMLVDGVLVYHALEVDIDDASTVPLDLHLRMVVRRQR